MYIDLGGSKQGRAAAAANREGGAAVEEDDENDDPLVSSLRTGMPDFGLKAE